MPFPSSSVLRKLSHPRLLDDLQAVGHFPRTVSLQSQPDFSLPQNRTASGGLIYNWTTVVGYEQIPCVLYDQLTFKSGQRREEEIIEELKWWTIKLKGFYPNIDPAWRAVMDDGGIYDIEGTEADSLHISTTIICRQFTPTAQAGV